MITRERSRGDILHSKVGSVLGYSKHQDNGQFPDIPNQLLEIKLQTSPTIDLGLVKPDSKEILNFPKIDNYAFCHKDVRYAIFAAKKSDGAITITQSFLVTGEDFFDHFRQFQGKVRNGKLQIPLPRDFFDR